MHIVIPDDYQDAVRHLAAFAKLKGHQVTVYNDTVKDVASQVERFKDADAIVLIRERTSITPALLEKLPKLKLISQTGKVSSNIKVADCTARGVAVAEGTGSPHSTAELTWALVLGAMRHLPQEVENMKRGGWQQRRGAGRGRVRVRDGRLARAAGRAGRRRGPDRRRHAGGPFPAGPVPVSGRSVHGAGGAGAAQRRRVDFRRRLGRG